MNSLVTATPTESTALAVIGDDDVFATYANAVAPRNVIGTLLKFSKGDYLAGEEGAPVPTGTVVTGDLDQDKWERDNHGEPRDPWQFTNYLPMLNESGELFTFTSASRGGISAIGELCRRYSQHRKRHSDVLPMIALDVDSYQHKVKEYGRIKVPRFTPAGWEPRAKFDAALASAGFAVAEDAPAGPLPSPADEMSDEIPF